MVIVTNHHSPITNLLIVHNSGRDNGNCLRAVVECKYHLGGVTGSLEKNTADYVPADSAGAQSLPGIQAAILDIQFAVGLRETCIAVNNSGIGVLAVISLEPIADYPVRTLSWLPCESHCQTFSSRCSRRLLHRSICGRTLH